MNILITGASGYIGKYLSRSLVDFSDKLTRIVSQNSTEGDYKCDLSKYSNVKDLENIDFDVILHAAANVPLVSGKEDTIEGANLNRSIDKNVINLAAEKQAHLIYLSTCGLYKIYDPALKSEDSDIETRSYYFESKLEGELLAMSYSNSAIMRISSPYIQDALPSNVIKIFYEQAKNNKKIEVWGDGSTEQDFFNLADLSIWLKTILSIKSTGIYNSVSGHTINMYQLAKHIKGENNLDIKFLKNKETVRYARYDNAKLVKLTDHKPQNIMSLLPCIN